MHVLQMICWEAVCRSQGQLVDLAMLDFCNDDFLFCLADSRYLGDISAESIQKVSRHCPMLETLKMNKAVVFGSQDWEEGRIYNDTAIAIAIGENMRELKHLELFGNNMLNDGLKAILDGCPHIESLDLRQSRHTMLLLTIIATPMSMIMMMMIIIMKIMDPYIPTLKNSLTLIMLLTMMATMMISLTFED
uniref:Uncharacterized protein n=1 Tax=Tanacetum cinerariifolium TaxID=118510 RepID=A0A699GV85_TANCI|nr:hypothetical protein [Tanacetum cinerariifolium]